MRCEAVDGSGLDWSFEKEERVGSWNGKSVKEVASEETLATLYQTTRAGHVTVIPVDYYSSNDESYNSFNDPSSANSRDEPSGSGNTYDGSANNHSSDSSRNVLDLAKDVAGAVVAARDKNWVEAAAKSLDVAQDVLDISKDVGEALVESRADAVEGGYAQNSDLGFQ